MDGNLSGSNFVGNQSTPPTGGLRTGSKKGILIVLVEIFIILFLVGFVLFVLNFLKIISINSFLPQPVKQLTTNIAIGQPSIKIESEVNGYKAELINKSELIKLLDSWQTFDRPYSFGGAGSTGGKPLRNINIHLTDKFDSSKFPWTLYKDKSGKEYLSSNIKLTPDTLDLYVFISNDILSNDDQNIDNLVQRISLGTLYKMTHIPAPGEDPVKREDTITNLLKDLYSNKTIHFKVTKQ